jgi:hypothetical protein
MTRLTTGIWRRAGPVPLVVSCWELVAVVFYCWLRHRGGIGRSARFWDDPVSFRFESPGMAAVLSSSTTKDSKDFRAHGLIELFCRQSRVNSRLGVLDFVRIFPTR